MQPEQPKSTTEKKPELSASKVAKEPKISAKKEKKSSKAKGKVSVPVVRDAIVITVTIHKGGVGKTTTATNVAGVLAALGKKVLLIDCDSQGDLSGVFLEGHEQLPLSVADVFGETGVDPHELIQPTRFDNIDIIPADRRLEAQEKTSGFETDARVTALQEVVERVKGEYDFIVLDSATRPHLTGFAALMAADILLVPLEGSQFSFRSIASIRKYLDTVQQIKPTLKVRYFLSRTKRTKLNELYRSTLTEVLGEGVVLNQDVPESSAITSAINLKTPIVFHLKNAKATQSLQQLVTELLSSLAS